VAVAAGAVLQALGCYAAEFFWNVVLVTEECLIAVSSAAILGRDTVLRIPCQALPPYGDPPRYRTPSCLTIHAKWLYREK